MKITNVGDHYEEGSQVMTIESKKALKSIRSIEVIGEGGKATALKSVGNSSWGFGDNKTYRQELVVAGKAADIKKLKVTYFQDLKKVEVPVDVNVSFSLSK